MIRIVCLAYYVQHAGFGDTDMKRYAHAEAGAADDPHRIGRGNCLSYACSQVGGRANRVGLNALYLALDHDTAIRECQQLSSLLPPGTLVSYNLTAAPIVDFTSGYESGKWSSLWDDFYCDWRHCWFNERIEPPSWILGDEVVSSGAKGILFKSRLTPDD